MINDEEVQKDLEAIAIQLQSQRLKLKLNYKELAKLSGVGSQVVRRMLKGGKHNAFDMLKVARALDLKVKCVSIGEG